VAKIVIECADPNDFEAMIQAAQEAAGKCNITYAKQAEALKEAGVVKSEREAARKIAEETGEPEKTVMSRIYRGKNEMTAPAVKAEFETNQDTSADLEKLEKPEHNTDALNRVMDERDRKKPEPPKHGGARKGAGRKKKEAERCEYLSSNKQFAIMAISQLERINEKDPEEAIAALNRVKLWINDRVAKIEKRMKG
jgi:hypothetical protein